MLIYISFYIALFVIFVGIAIIKNKATCKVLKYISFGWVDIRITAKLNKMDINVTGYVIRYIGSRVIMLGICQLILCTTALLIVKVLHLFEKRLNINNVGGYLILVETILIVVFIIFVFRRIARFKKKDYEKLVFTKIRLGFIR